MTITDVNHFLPILFVRRAQFTEDLSPCWLLSCQWGPWLALTSSLSTLVSSYKCWQFGIEGFTSISHLPSHLELQWPICQLSRPWLGWLSSLAACKHAARYKSSKLTAEHGALTPSSFVLDKTEKLCFHFILQSSMHDHSLESWKWKYSLSKTECVTLIQLKTFVLILRWKIL